MLYIALCVHWVLVVTMVTSSILYIILYKEMRSGTLDYMQNNIILCTMHNIHAHVYYALYI